MKIKAFYSVVSAVVALVACCSSPAAPPPIPAGVAILTKANFASMTNADGRISMVEFYLPESHSCQEMDSSITRISSKYQGMVLIGKVNFMEEPNISGQYDIQVLPTFLFLKSGKEVRQLIREYPKEAPSVVEDSLVMIIDSIRAAR
jgi:thioredoxin-like negative regulator of GroEL